MNSKKTVRYRAREEGVRVLMRGLSRDLDQGSSR